MVGDIVTHTWDFRVDENTTVYVPPIEEFLLERIEITVGDHFNKVSKQGSIILVYEGNGNFQVGSDELAVDKGTVVFICAGSTLQCQAQTSMILLSCGCNCFES